MAEETKAGSKAEVKAEAKAKAKAEAKPGAGGGKLVPVLLVVNSLLLAGVLAVLLLKPLGVGGQHAAAVKGQEQAAEAGGHGGQKEKAEGDGKVGKVALPGPTLRMADFVVHLRDADADRYARVSFEMELADEKAKEAVTQRMPQIRDAFLAYLSDRTAEDLRGSEAMVRVKGALGLKLFELAPGAPVRGLYVTELVVQ
jgi:flagellar protein FliL